LATVTVARTKGKKWQELLISSVIIALAKFDER
ncbi:MAG: hypothetical protein ACI85O_001874, partial [Saprospiraceae bacterium]